jgi:uncharacterized protein YbjT (DUF2867 family)
MADKIVVFGGTGFVGRALCEKLAARSPAGRVTVPTRRAAHANKVRFLPTVLPVATNVHGDQNALARLIAGHDAVVNLIAILHGSRAEFEQAHVAWPQRLVQACKAAGVKRLLHIGALGAGAQAPSEYLRSKTAGEAVFTGSGLDVTVLRPSVIFGAEDRFLNLFAELQGVAPLMPLAGRSARFQPVWVEDVASALVNALDRPSSIGQTYECTGPTEYTLGELVRLAGEWSGSARPQIALPSAIGRLQALAMELLPGPPLMSRDNLDSMRVPNVATGTLPNLAALGIRATALEAVAPGYLSGLATRARLDRFRALARRG